jgi:hypothetical protein
MKRTREVTAIHYRRSVRRSASPDLQSQALGDRCPVCGSPLEAGPVNDPEDTQGGGLKAVRGIALRLMQPECGKCSEKFPKS